jgi:hypothetical protein
MAYKRADPRPFAPQDFQAMKIQHREMMAQAVVSHQLSRHEDFDIVSMNPLPGAAIQFGPLQEVIFEFLEDHLHIEVREIQPTHLGQALVWFVHVHDRDLLVNHSPYLYGDVQISFVRHNEDRNWRAMNFKQECWLMLLGFPLDYWNSDKIESAIASFGRMLIWENDRSHLDRLLVRARLSDLQDVPYFLVVTKVEGFQWQSWTMQCKILEQCLLEVLP